MFNLLVLILVIPFITAGLSFFVGKESEKIRDVINVLATSLTFLLIIMLYPSVSNGVVEYSISDIMGTGLHLKVDMLRYAMLFISGLAWFLATMFSTQYIKRRRHRNRYYFFFMLTYAFTLGIFMSDNIINLFTFFEGMSLTSYALVIHDEDEYSHDAGISYLSMALAGGLILLMGIFLAYDYTKTLEIAGIAEGMKNVSMGKQYMLGALFIIGFGIKASMFPLHTWLPQTYTAAPAPATAILSAILLKTGLFGVIITTHVILNGNERISYIILIIGLINILLGGILAVMQRNIKRIIAYSSMSQTGFMLVGIGLVGILGDHGGLAILGTLLYMINHAVFKLLLFFAAGIIYMILHEMSLNKIWGFGKNKKRLKTLFLIGVFGIIGMPGFNGFTSKTLIHEAIIEAQHLTHLYFFDVVELIFYLGGALTVAYMMKLFIAIFVEKNSDFHGQYKERFRKRAQFPLAILAAIVIFIGLFPNYIVGILSSNGMILSLHVPESIRFFTFDTILSSAITLIFGAMIYFLIVRSTLISRKDDRMVYSNPSYNWFALEKNIYQPLFINTYKALSIIFKFLDVWLINTVSVIVKFGEFIGNIDKSILPKLEWDRLLLELDSKRSEVDVKQKVRDKSDLFKEKYIDGKSTIKTKISNNKELIGNTIEDHKEVQGQKVKDILETFNIKLTSITFSVFLMGIVIVLSYIFIFASR